MTSSRTDVYRATAEEALAEIDELQTEILAARARLAEMLGRVRSLEGLVAAVREIVGPSVELPISMREVTVRSDDDAPLPRRRREAWSVPDRPTAGSDRDRSTHERAAQERALQERAIQERAASDRAALHRAVSDRAVAERAAADRAQVLDRGIIDRTPLRSDGADGATSDGATPDRDASRADREPVAAHANGAQ